MNTRPIAAPARQPAEGALEAPAGVTSGGPNPQPAARKRRTKAEAPGSPAPASPADSTPAKAIGKATKVRPKVAARRATAGPMAAPEAAHKGAKANNRASPAKPSAPDKARKAKVKPVRDSFTMPQADFALIATLKHRALVFQRPAKKSEILRAGLHALLALGDRELRAALDGLTPLKPGRPKNSDQS